MEDGGSCLFDLRCLDLDVAHLFLAHRAEIERGVQHDRPDAGFHRCRGYYFVHPWLAVGLQVSSGDSQSANTDHYRRRRMFFWGGRDGTNLVVHIPTARSHASTAI